MSEGEKGIHFTQIQQSLQSDSLEEKFKYDKFVSRAEVKKYAQKIIDEINKFDDPEQQQIIIIDLLSESEILEFSKDIIDLQYPEFFELKKKKNGDNTTDFEEIKLMVTDTIKAIRKQVIEELKPYISPKLLMFVIKKFSDQGKNNTALINDSENQTTFFKEASLSKEPKYFVAQKESLEILKKAIERLGNTEEEMPYVAKPLLISSLLKNSDEQRQSIVYTTTKRDLVNIYDIVEGEEEDLEISRRDCLLAAIDCLRGAKFLADNGLTLTDLQLKNIGIDKKTKKGILFDLDGLLQTNKKVDILIGPDVDFWPPEYQYTRPLIAASQSMIWEMGMNFLNIAIDQIEPGNLWEKIYQFAQKMIVGNPDDRPDFDTCIAELTKIVNENFSENQQ